MKPNQTNLVLGSGLVYGDFCTDEFELEVYGSDDEGSQTWDIYVNDNFLESCDPREYWIGTTSS